MRVTKWGEYGILFSLYLAKAGPNAAIGAAELADFHHIPLQYAQQILQRLRKGGIVKSLRGPGGGYRLAETAKKVNLKQILYAVEGGTFNVICDYQPLKVDVCSNPEGCALHNLWRNLKDAIDNMLEKQNLAGMLLTHCSNIPSQNGKMESAKSKPRAALRR